MESQRVYRILVVLLLILPGKNFSQQQTPLIAQKMPHALQSFPKVNLRTVHSIHYFFPENSLDKIPGCILTNDLVVIINSNFYASHVGFFCHQELLFEKKTYVPLRFRLGSLNYVNRMEGKNKFEVLSQ
jgi:hypothetical protein